MHRTYILPQRHRCCQEARQYLTVHLFCRRMLHYCALQRIRLYDRTRTFFATVPVLSSEGKFYKKQKLRTCWNRKILSSAEKILFFIWFKINKEKE